MAGAKDPVGPSQIYIVSTFFSDAGALFYYRVIDVRQEGADALIRYSRIAPVSQWCPRIMVQSAEARVRNTSPAALVGSNNPCAVNPRELRAVLKKYPGHEGVFEAISFAIVAQCGPSTTVLRLPIEQKVDWKGLRQVHPEMARLWDLTGEITNPVFGSKDIFHDATDEEERVLQQTGEKMVPELRFGQFDIGLTESFHGNVGTWPSPTFQSLLEGYLGPVSAEQAKGRAIAQLLSAQEYRFLRFVPPTYPPLAAQAHVTGLVDLQLTVDRSIGNVLDVAASGHPLLTAAAIDAAKRWLFVPESIASGTVNLTLNYSLQCR